MKGNMFYGASNLIFEKSKRVAESNDSCRQHPIANYVADFYCHEKKLVIELDGGVHNAEEVKKYDEYREEHLKESGLTILRFKNEQI
ncbi:MAG TPA: endonuclease domain-containing protein [Chitinophagaceae bacterium]|nr:endonuclease domain-containing protein [Chitinophagaceae bacterium]